MICMELFWNTHSGAGSDLCSRPIMCVYTNRGGSKGGARGEEVGAPGPLLAGPPAVPASMHALPPCPQAACRPHPPRAGQDATGRTRPPPRGRPSGATQMPMPTRATLQTRSSWGDPRLRPPGPGPPRLQRQDPRGLETSSPHSLCLPQPRAHRVRPKKIVFEDELPAQALLGTKRPIGAIPGGYTPRPYSVPDYELKYPPVSTKKERSRYAAVFQDQYSEFLELQQEVASAQAKLEQLQTLLNSLPPPHSQKEACVTARVWREFEKKQMVSHDSWVPHLGLCAPDTCAHFRGEN
ncbi:occludin/ELL domain-containing protein 1 isoform 1-T1 [Dugong dugon]